MSDLFCSDEKMKNVLHHTYQKWIMHVTVPKGLTSTRASKHAIEQNQKKTSYMSVVIFYTKYQHNFLIKSL